MALHKQLMTDTVITKYSKAGIVKEIQNNSKSENSRHGFIESVHGE